MAVNKAAVAQKRAIMSLQSQILNHKVKAAEHREAGKAKTQQMQQLKGKRSTTI